MATKPFSINVGVPGDTDIVSVFPALDRTDKDVLQSWLLTDHNVDGTHTQSTMVQVGTLLSDGSTTTVTPTPTSGRTAIYRDTDGALKAIKGDDSTVDFMGGVPPGTVVWTAVNLAGNVPGLTSAGTGIFSQWLYCAGQAVSRTTFSRLFHYIGATFGAGDGSTTFNVPDIRNRSVYGIDGYNGAGVSGRITTAGGNFDGTLLSNGGGAQNVTLTLAQLPVFSQTPTFTGNARTWSLNQSVSSNSNISGSFAAPSGGIDKQAITPTVTVTPDGSISAVTFGSGQSHPVMNPAIILIPIIRI